MLTIDEIKNRKNLGKRKWGFSLILLLIDKFDDNLPYEAICNELSQNHQFEISPDGLAHIKARHYTKVKKLMEQLTVQKSKSYETPEHKVVQKGEVSNAEILYNKIYQKKNSNNEFDLGRDF
jgi:hypothetical protein